MKLQTYPSKVTSWEDVLLGLRSGEYTQTQGAMCHIGTYQMYGKVYDREAYCPLGIIALLSGAKFELHGTDEIACDDNGEEGVPDWSILKALSLTEYMTEEELDSCWNYKTAMLFYYEGEVRRYEAIAFMNDNLGLNFAKIADEIERLGWNT